MRDSSVRATWQQRGGGARWWVLACWVALASACGDGGGGFSSNKVARLEAFNNGISLPLGGTIGVAAALVEPGTTGSAAVLRLVNTGEADLKISDITIESEPPGVFTLAGGGQGEALPAMPLVVAPETSFEGVRSVFVNLMFHRPQDSAPAQATIRVRSNSVSLDGKKQPEITFKVVLQAGRPIIAVQPTSVNFGPVQIGRSGVSTLSVLNLGQDRLVVDSFTLAGNPNFKLIIGTTEYPANEAAAAGIVLDTPLTVEPGTSVPLTLQYKAEDGSEARGELVLFSNDPESESGLTVPIQANVGGPCVLVNPKRVDFGGKLIGRTARVELEITSCGDEPLELKELELVAAESAETFSLDLTGLPGTRAQPGRLGLSDVPVRVAPNSSVVAVVQYFPDELSPWDTVTGEPTYDTGRIRINTNTFQGEVTVDVRGFGVDVECPTAVIVIPEGEEVVPQTRLHLIGSQSYAVTGSVVSYQWEVSAPLGSADTFMPSPTQDDPTFDVNVVGEYTFRLTVKDSAGEPSCIPATAKVYVNPDQALHVELLWDTPNDPDQSDTGPVAGADLDLHFLHKNATGTYDGDGDGKPDGWFDIPYDCFWSNKFPEWGSSDSRIDDNPRLDRDDTDGAGPENLNLNTPEDGMEYRVGVHYWNDNGFGSSFVTVRAFVYSNVVFEASDIELVEKDFWSVTTIKWPMGGQTPVLTQVCKGTFTTCTSDAECSGGATCGPRIASNYVHPFYPSD